MDVKEIIESMSAVAQCHPKAEIAVAMIENIINIAGAVQKQAARMPKYKLPRIAYAARRRQKEAIAMMGLSMWIGASRQLSILSQPIPKITGAFPSGGVAIVGDNHNGELLTP